MLLGKVVYPHLYHPAFVGLIILLLPLWVAALGAADAQTVMAARDNRARGAGRS